MGFVATIGMVLKRQQSGGEQLLDLLKDPFGDQVRFKPTTVVVLENCMHSI